MNKVYFSSIKQRKENFFKQTQFHGKTFFFLDWREWWELEHSSIKPQQ